ncbi:MAG: carbohydrate ABC transporter permease [Desulfobacterales bacterium]|nr:MAG: carbohydrate ABC transporter permease [Desulfobacterales bacterium]
MKIVAYKADLSEIGMRKGGGASRRWALVGAYAALVVFMLFLLVPPYYMLLVSLKTNSDLLAKAGNHFWFQEWPTLAHYFQLLFATPFLRQLGNTVLVSSLVALITLAVSIPAAYSLTRLHFWGSTALTIGVFITYLVPETLLFIPFFKIVVKLGVYNSKWVLVVVYPTLTVPFCTWILLGYFASVPREMDEAAMVDGAGPIQMMVRVFIPVTLPGIIAATIFAFVVAWSNFIYPLAFILNEAETVLTAGMVSIDGVQLKMAGSLIASMPPLLVYAFLMDYYVAGLTRGEVIR